MKQWLTSHEQKNRPWVGKPSNLSRVLTWEPNRASAADGRSAKARGVGVGGVKVKPPKYLVQLESPGTLLQNMPPSSCCWRVCVWGVTLPCLWSWLLLIQAHVSNVLWSHCFFLNQEDGNLSFPSWSLPTPSTCKVVWVWEQRLSGGSSSFSGFEITGLCLLHSA